MRARARRVGLDTGFSFSAAIALRHWPSAMVWLCTVLSSESLTPGRVIS